MDVRPGDFPNCLPEPFAVILGREFLVTGGSEAFARRLLARVPGSVRIPDGRVIFPEVPPARGWHRKLRDSCLRGHDLRDPLNVYINPTTGARQCRTCARWLQRSRRHPKASKGTDRA